MKTYDPLNWFWVVGGNAAQVYSSAVSNYVPIADATYVTWTADGTIPTRIGTAAELGEVLALALVKPAPIPPDVLAGYQDAIVADLTKAANADLFLYAINTARAANAEIPVALPAFGAFIKNVIFGASPEPRRVKRTVIVDRLNAANKINALVAHFNSHKFEGERWYATESVPFDDADMIALLNDIGADPNVILAA